jgi:hypothetical protein
MRSAAEQTEAELGGSWSILARRIEQLPPLRRGERPDTQLRPEQRRWPPMGPPCSDRPRLAVHSLGSQASRR